MGMPIIQPGQISTGEAVGNIIESIAMQEAAQAHILNAESEKILTMINNVNVTPQQLLRINKCTKDMINSIVRQETILQAKLDLFAGIICE